MIDWKTGAPAVWNLLSFWHVLTEKEKDAVAASSTTVSYKSGAVIHNCTSADSQGVYVVLQGRVRVFISSPEGKQLTILRTANDQHFSFGHSCVLEKFKYGIGFETLTGCEIMLIPRQICKIIYDSNAEVRLDFINRVAGDFSWILCVLESVALAGMKNRLANALIERSMLIDSLEFKASPSEIAEDIGTVREAVSRSMHDFGRRGLISIQKGKVRINDMQALIDLRGDYLAAIYSQMSE